MIFYVVVRCYEKVTKLIRTLGVFLRLNAVATFSKLGAKYCESL